ncbi:hypothetical protein G7025_16815 [Pseudomonas lurida]|uniref:Uncharacterized protein n=1 Tax=Pseudomonas quebecensis TaxID=2995174 RepID=A0ABY6QFS0_9PSED|nr:MULTISPECIES: hypothetical protein [Pseudomonas]MBA1295021.1 hypothetical protein [Pseudomonas lurida]MCP1514029.1 hypothetical protein [Pseudomonas rhodesiae]MCX4063060.1 hypothetical protein [Pseudomonas quebecensis]MDF9767743.1 hypothetical protein [Pseudomonas rhodesiae]UZW18246.1 hypothetical protein OSC50_23170 [Pseudomonas quebecensis]
MKRIATALTQNVQPGRCRNGAGMAGKKQWHDEITAQQMTVFFVSKLAVFRSSERLMVF